MALKCLVQSLKCRRLEGLSTGIIAFPFKGRVVGSRLHEFMEVCDAWRIGCKGPQTDSQTGDYDPRFQNSDTPMKWHEYSRILFRLFRIGHTVDMDKTTRFNSNLLTTRILTNGASLLGETIPFGRDPVSGALGAVDVPLLNADVVTALWRPLASETRTPLGRLPVKRVTANCRLSTALSVDQRPHWRTRGAICRTTSI